MRACTSDWVQPQPLPSSRLWLIKINGSWMAAHAPMDCVTVIEALQGMQPAFGSNENILQEGPHEWNYFLGTDCQSAGRFETLHLQ